MSLLIIRTFDLFDNLVYNEATKSKEDSQMEEYKYDESNGLWYELKGDYYLPCLTVPEQDDRPIEIWGQQRKNYLRHHHKILYTNLITSCKLHAHLADINEEATAMFDRLVEHIAKQEGVSEQMKATDMLEWVKRMNNIHNRAAEIVNNEIIYN